MIDGGHMSQAQLPKVSDMYSAQQAAQFRAQGHWRDDTPASILDHWVERQPDASFMTDGVRAVSYAGFRSQAYRLAAALRRRGIAKGDTVLIQLPSWAEFAVAAMAASRIGAIVVPVLPIYRSDEVRYLLQHSRAKAAVCTGIFRNFDHLAMFRALRSELPSLETLVVARGEADGEGEFAFDTLAQPDAGAALPDALELGEGPTADDGHVIVYTSGTESRPKGCFYTFNTVDFSLRTMQREHAWTTNDVAFGPSPLAHSTGYITSYLLPLRAGAASHVMDVWDPEAGLRRIAEHRCTITTTATTFLRMLVEAYRPGEHDASSMRVWIAAGSAIPAQVVQAAREVLPTCEILSHYGRSENQVSTTCPVDVDPSKVLSSDGRPPAGVQIAILGEQDQHLPPNEVGDIAYKGPGHMLGYFRNPDQTRAMFSPDRFSRSGDLGYLDEDGFVRVSGRAKDIIIRGGMNISAREIEEHLLAHPAIADVAVVAMPDERLGERVCAFIVPAPGRSPTLAEVCAYLRDDRGIAMQKLPERLETIEALPTTLTGKVQKFVLRERIAQQLQSEATGAATRAAG
jgi:acyl-coenzyme A synthetase/AMP-(fatty) acid ligase